MDGIAPVTSLDWENTGSLSFPIVVFKVSTRSVSELTVKTLKTTSIGPNYSYHFRYSLVRWHPENPAMWRIIYLGPRSASAVTAFSSNCHNSWMLLLTAPAAELRWAIALLSPHPPEYTPDVSRRVHISIPDRPAVVAN